MTANTFYRISDANSVQLFVRASAGAKRDEISGIWRGSDEPARLAVRISAPPDKGRANTAIIGLLAKVLERPKSSFSVASGHTSRLKTILVKASAPDLVCALVRLTGEGI